MTVDLASTAALAALTLILVQIALRLPLGQAIGAITGPSLRSVAVLRARGISDHWKERAMKLYAWRTLKGVAWFTAQLLLLAAVALGIGAVIAAVVPGFVDFSIGFQGIVVTLVVAVLWLWVLKALGVRRAAPRSDYTPMEQMMHRVALGNGAVAEMGFALDQLIARPDAEAARIGGHVFVAGLARAGTTVLTRALHESGAFGSLTYRDMPFVLAPTLWGKLNRRGGVQASERAHGDGLVVDLDSVESLEEPFWRVFDGAAYIKADRLLPHVPEAALVSKYRRYVGAILKARGAGRYLAKNNNNILRLGMLAEAFPDAHLLVPFRDPVAHAGSLRAQHARFAETHAKDPFSRDYMGWLAHHEFGSDHRWFAVGDKPEGDPTARDYWLAEWCSVYDWLLETAPERVRFVCYEDLCNDPAAWSTLAEEIGIEAGNATPFRAADVAAREGLSELEARAYAIYDRLRTRG
ncbi:sulfotransferase [Marimonas arenosa]|uniref:Sulfotransferase n=1 Tax=Marimonas arenosa TaxID=1795305 RepID=A0AAE4B7J6_9RHOB|nr:sulfotransferase [Marimonas arenosa]MDQ2091596.1 sulfotransferase [Marimonas arenosa]